MGYRLLALACLLGLLLVVAPTAQAHPHVVQPGESLWSISAANGISVESLAAANGLPPETHVWAGRVVEVPVAAAAATPPFSSNGRLPSSALTAIHSPLGHATLASDAAGAWEEMRQASLTELGVDIYPAGPAVDLASPEMRRAIDQLGPRYGWAKVEADDEWFHVNYLGR